MTKAFRVNIRQYALEGPGKTRTRRAMPKNPVTVSYFNAELAAVARNTAMKLANDDDNRLVMLRPNVYVVMNSATHALARPKVIKRLRMGYGHA